MLFRIDHEHFLTHAIDHFTRSEILSMQFVIITAGIQSSNDKYIPGMTLQANTTGNTIKVNELYPDFDTQEIYHRFQTKDSIREMYFDFLKDLKYVIHNAIINPLLQFHNIVLICKMRENDYMDLLVEYLEKKFAIDCVDLNELFSTGRVGPYYIDRDEIHNKAVGVRREAMKSEKERLEKTPEGRLKLMTLMSKKEKLKFLKKLGIEVKDSEHDQIDDLLMEEYVGNGE